MDKSKESTNEDLSVNFIIFFINYEFFINNILININLNTEDKMEGNKLNKTLNCTGDDKDKEECKVDQMVTQFKILIVIIFILLIFFLGCYVYNLIKCYLPKWRKKKFTEEERQVEIRNN